MKIYEILALALIGLGLITWSVWPHWEWVPVVAFGPVAIGAFAGFMRP